MMLQVMLLTLETEIEASLGCRARDFVILLLFCLMLEIVIGFMTLSIYDFSFPFSYFGT